MTSDAGDHSTGGERHANGDLIERCREFTDGSGITTDDVLAALDEVRAEREAHIERICDLVAPVRSHRDD